MISFSGSLKIFLLVDCCDMRKGFNGLYGLVSSSFGEDPRSGALYVFTNRRHSRIKVLYFDVTDGVDLRGAKLRPWYERE
jgi:transposase